MKNYLITKTRTVFGIKSLENKFEHLNKQNELIALQLLKELMPKTTFIPLTVWSISPSTMLHIVNEIIVNKRKSIIEFGSGFSTFIISKLIKANNLDIKFYSVDSNKDWINYLENDLKKEGINEFVNMIHAPVCKSPYIFREHKSWYDSDILNRQLKKQDFDLVIVDGPPGDIMYSRYGAIPFLKTKLNDSFFLVLDDTNRVLEHEIISEWGNMLNQEVVKYKNYSVISKGSKFVSLPIYHRAL